MFTYAPIVAFLALGLTPVLADESPDLTTRTRSLKRKGGGGSGSPAITLAVFGDWPYSQELLDNAMDLVDSINDDNKVSLAVHLGDIHSGSMPCTGAGINGPATLTTTSDELLDLTLPVVNPAWNSHVFSIFHKFDDPLIFTPGDNEWADCHKVKQFSSGAPLAELEGVREMFFAKPGVSMGRKAKLVTSQATAFTNPADAQFVENVMWMDGDVFFATFNMPGGSNNNGAVDAPWTGDFADDEAQEDERKTREAANLRWLDASFNKAIQKGAKAVVIMSQADLWNTENLPAPGLTNYSPFVKKLATRSRNYNKPVLVLNGDSHVFKMDSPLVSNGASGPLEPMCDTSEDPETLCDLTTIHGAVRAPKLRRITVQGSGEGGELIWLKLTINTRATSLANVFKYENVCYGNCGPV